MAKFYASLVAVTALLFTMPTSAAQDHHEPTPRIATSGSGTVQITPDRAWVNLAVQAEAKDVQSAQKEVDATVQRFLKLTDSLDIPRKHVASANLSVQPRYEWEDKPRRRNLMGYTVARQLTVDLRELDELGALLSRSLQLGVNTASAPQFDHTDRERFEREALAMATRDARDQAQTMAGAIGLQLGKVLSLRSNGQSSRPQPVRQVRMMAADSAGAEASYEPGELTVRAQVSIEYAIAQ